MTARRPTIWSAALGLLVSLSGPAPSSAQDDGSRFGEAIDRLTFLPVDQGYSADAELRLAAVDRQGGQSEIPIMPPPPVFDAQPAPASVVAYEATVRLRREPHDLAVSLYDRLSGRLLVATAAVEPPGR